MNSTLSGITALLSEEQEANTFIPMLVTLAGISMLSSEEQPVNADIPMLVALWGIVTLVIEEQFENAPYKMFPPVTVTDLSNVGMQYSVPIERDVLSP